MSPTLAQAIACNDRYRTLLRKALEILSAGTLESWLTDLEACISDPDADHADKLESNAMLVGVLSVMIERIEGN